jgi:hypothetical protein
MAGELPELAPEPLEVVGVPEPAWVLDAAEHPCTAHRLAMATEPTIAGVRRSIVSIPNVGDKG